MSEKIKPETQQEVRQKTKDFYLRMAGKLAVEKPEKEKSDEDSSV